MNSGNKENEMDINMKRVCTMLVEKDEYNDDILVSLRYEQYIDATKWPIKTITYRECYITDREIRNSSIRSIYISFKGYLKLAFGDVL